MDLARSGGVDRIRDADDNADGVIRRAAARRPAARAA
jgi:hypothetical protein